MTTIGTNLGRRAALVAVGAFCVMGAACTLINSYDELVPQKVEPPDASSGGLDSSLQGDVVSSSPDSGGGGSRDAGGPADAAAEEAAAVAAAHGVIVIGGEISNDAGRQVVLTAIDPSTGSELPKARTALNVAGVQYDPAGDLWYVFESGGAGIFPLPTDPFYLHTFTLDTITGKWTELGHFAVPPGVSFATTAVIPQRVSYIAYGDGTIEGGVPVDGGSPYSLVTLDTSDPTAVTVVSEPIPLASGYGALIGLRSDVNAAGGFLGLGSTAKLDGGVTVSLLTPVLVPGSGSPSLEQPILGTAAAGSLVGYGNVTSNGEMHALVITRPNGTAPATLSIFDPAATDPTMALLGAGTFPFADSNVKAPAFSACAQMAFVVGTNSDLSVHAVSIAAIGQAEGGVYPALSSTSAATGHSGQGVYFEPYTNTVLAPFSQGDNFALTAFTLTGTASAPELVQRLPPRWVPPPDLRPSFVATKTPFPDECASGDDD
jgi:hypothetical protein